LGLPSNALIERDLGCWLGAVGGRDGHRRIDREAAAVVPSGHRPGFIVRQQVAAHEPAQQPPAHLRPHGGDGVGIERGGGPEGDPARGAVEHAVDDHAVEVQVGIEAGAEAVSEGHRAKACRGAGIWAVRPQALLHRAQEQAPGSTFEVGIALQEVAQPLGHGKYPPQRQVRQDVLGEMRRRRRHAPGVARWAHAAPLARERDQEIVPAVRAADGRRRGRRLTCHRVVTIVMSLTGDKRR
jgi:hypothetical protein